MGYASGYLLPTLLYYKVLGTEPEPGPARGGSTVTALPMFDGSAFGLNLMGVF
jgi:hypothetical protein